MKYCTNCGQALEDQALFCSVCGAKVPDILEELGQAFYNGDQTAFEKIYKNTEGWVRGFVHRRIREAEVDDCMQTIYVKVYEKISSFSGEEGKFRGWFSAIVHTTTIDYARKHGRQDEHETALYQGDADDEYELQIPDTCPIPEEVLEREETAQIFREILDDMSQEQRTCLMLYYYEGKKQSDIASELGVSENTVKSRLRLGKQHVKARVLQLEKQGTKLYGMGPIPFFVYLLRYMEQAIETGYRGALVSQDLWPGIASAIQNIQSGGAGGSALSAEKASHLTAEAQKSTMASESAKNAATAGKAVAGKSAAAKGAAGIAGKTAGKAVLTKILTGIVSVGVIGGAFFGGYKATQAIQNRNESEIVEPISDDNNDKQTEPETPEKESPEEKVTLPKIPELHEFNTAISAYVDTIQINEDGTFSGQWQDRGIGFTGKGSGSVYHGRFSDIKKVDEYTYMVTVDTIEYDKEPGTEEKDTMVEGATITYTTVDIYKGDVFLIYLPGKPFNEMNDNYTRIAEGIGYVRPDVTQNDTLDGYAFTLADREGPFYWN